MTAERRRLDELGLDILDGLRISPPPTVQRKHGHRYDRCEVFCSRCGVHVSEADEKKCMPSNVEVLVRR